jgi:hypothetical protein
MERAQAAVRVERGQVREDELAALAAALLMVRTRARKAAGRPPAAAPRWWRRPEGYRAPGSWR